MNVSPDGAGIVKVDGASQADDPSFSEFATGTVVSIEAIPAPGYVFMGWSGGFSSVENPATVEMTCPRDLTANFSPAASKLRWPLIGGVGGTVIAGGLTIGIYALLKRRRGS